jgi:predicted glutamine amidotransferase
MPAWGDPNLRDIAGQIESRLFLAHVRAATGTAVQQTNSHPFRFGRWLFVHNGFVAGYEHLRHDLILGRSAAVRERAGHDRLGAAFSPGAQVRVWSGT